MQSEQETLVQKINTLEQKIKKDQSHKKVQKKDKSNQQPIYASTFPNDSQYSNEYIPLRARGDLINLVTTDSSYGVNKTFEQFPGSKLPLAFLMARSLFGSPEDGNQALVFGGMIEADFMSWWGDSFKDTQPTTSPATENYSSGDGLYLTAAKLDMLANINEWTQAVMILKASSQTKPVFDTLFVTFGNFDKSPFFATIGKSRLPGGTYVGGGPWTHSLGKEMFRPGRPVSAMLGYNKDGLQSFLSLFSKNSKQSSSDQFNFLYSIFYYSKIEGSGFSYNFNFSYLYDVQGSGSRAASRLTPLTGTPGTPVTTTPIKNRNPLMNTEGFISYKNYYALFGWSGTLFNREYTNNSTAGAWYVQFLYYADFSVPILKDANTIFSIAWNQAYNTRNLEYRVPGNGNLSPGIFGANKQLVTFAQREMMDQVFLGLEYAWINTVYGAQSNSVTMDLTLYF